MVVLYVPYYDYCNFSWESFKWIFSPILLSERFLFGFQSVSKCPQVSFSATKAVYNDLLKKVFSHNSSDSQDDKTIANQMKLSAAKLRSLFLVPRTKVNLGLFC
jgi:predicted negative regulator of RcsB-dependent stress response